MKSYIIYTLILASSLSSAAILDIRCRSLLVPTNFLQFKMKKAASQIKWIKQTYATPEILFESTITYKNSEDFESLKIGNKLKFSFYDGINTFDTLYITINRKQIERYYKRRSFKVSAYSKNSNINTHLKKQNFRCYQ